MYYHGDANQQHPHYSFKITYDSTTFPEKNVSAHKFSDDLFILELKSGNEMIFKVHAKADKSQDSDDLGEAYRVDQGFVTIQKKKMNLKGIVIYCVLG